MLELASTSTWLKGPDWLTQPQENELNQLMAMPDECAKELRAQERRQRLGLLVTEPIRMINTIDVQRYGRLNTLLQVTSYVLMFIQLLKGQTSTKPLMALRSQSEVFWIKECQTDLICDPKFDSWKKITGSFLR